MKTTEDVRDSSGMGGKVGVATFGDRSNEQILPGGDLHVSGKKECKSFSVNESKVSKKEIFRKFGLENSLNFLEKDLQNNH